MYRTKKMIRSYLGFSKKELNGIFILFLAMLIILTISFFMPLFDHDSKYDQEAFKKEVERFKALSIESDEGNKVLKNNSTYKTRSIDYFEFDPNKQSSEQWLKLGLSRKQIAVIHNYEAKGGKFYTKGDLKKIYSISAEQFKKLEPYVRINVAALKGSAYPAASELKKLKEPISRNLVLIELNSADSTQLENVSGIGSVLASRIIRFRNRLGGFYSTTQLKEVYGIDSVKYEYIKRNFIVDRELIEKVDLNTVTFELLRRHPYLSYKQMNAIIQFRKQHGFFKSIDDLRKITILNEEIIRKIEPYIVLSP